MQMPATNEIEAATHLKPMKGDDCEKTMQLNNDKYRKYRDERADDHML